MILHLMYQGPKWLLKMIVFFQVFEFATPDLNVIPHSCPLSWVLCVACPNGLAWHLTQHNGKAFDHSIGHNPCMQHPHHKTESLRRYDSQLTGPLSHYVADVQVRTFDIISSKHQNTSY